MIIGAILVGVLIFVLIILGDYISNHGGSFAAGAFIGEFLTILIIIEIYLVFNIIGKPTPSSLDTYYDNTELEITSVSETPTDSVVVFEKK